MIYLNNSNLNKETQNRLLENSRYDVEQKTGNDLKAFAIENHLNYNEILDQ